MLIQKFRAAQCRKCEIAPTVPGSHPRPGVAAPMVHVVAKFRSPGPHKEKTHPMRRTGNSPPWPVAREPELSIRWPLRAFLSNSSSLPRNESQFPEAFPADW